MKYGLLIELDEPNIEPQGAKEQIAMALEPLGRRVTVVRVITEKPEQLKIKPKKKKAKEGKT